MNNHIVCRENSFVNSEISKREGMQSCVVLGVQSTQVQFCLKFPNIKLLSNLQPILSDSPYLGPKRHDAGQESNQDIRVHASFVSFIENNDSILGQQEVLR